MMLMWTLIVASMIASVAWSASFGTNLVINGDASSGNYNNWVASSDCQILNGYFNILPKYGNDMDCNMSQSIDVTVARDYLLHPGGRVTVTMSAYIKSGSPDYATFGVEQLECTSGTSRYTMGGQPLTSSSWQWITQSTRLMPNICSLRVSLYIRNHASDGASPTVNRISVVLTASPATITCTESTSRPFSTTTQSLSDRGTTTPTFSQQASVTAATTSLGKTSTVTFSASSSDIATTSSSGTTNLTSSLSTTHSTSMSSTVSPTSTLRTVTALATQTTPTQVFCGALDTVSLLAWGVNRSDAAVVPAGGLPTTTSIVSPATQQHDTLCRRDKAQNVMFELQAAPIPRETLLSTTSITAALQLADSMRWDIVNTTSGGIPLTPSLSATSDTGAWPVVLTPTHLAPLPSPWIPASVGLYQSTTVVLTLQLQCVVTDYHNATTRSYANITLQAPAPGQRQTWAQQVVSPAVLRAQLVGALAGAGVASGGARLAALAVAQCVTGDGGVSGLLPLSNVAPPRCNLTFAQEDDLAAVVGNWIAAVTGTAFVLLCCAVVALVMKISFVDAMRLLTFPLCVLPLWMAAMPSSTAAAVHLVTSFGGVTCTSLIASTVAAGLLMLAVVVSVVAWSTWYCRRHVRCTAIAPKYAISLSLGKRSLRELLLENMRVLFRRRSEWVALSVGASLPVAHLEIDQVYTPYSGSFAKLLPMRHLDALLSEFRCLEYAVLDVAVVAAVSALAGAALAAGTYAWCIGSLAASLALFVLQLAVCVALQPYVACFYFVHSVVVQVLSVLSTALTLGAAVLNAQSPKDVDTLEALSNAAAVCGLLAVGVVAVRTVIDVRSLVVALHRVVQRLRAAGAARQSSLLCAETTPPPPMPEDEFHRSVDGHAGVPDSSDVVFFAHVVEGDPIDESGFWDADGKYFSEHLPNVTSLILNNVDSKVESAQVSVLPDSQIALSHGDDLLLSYAAGCIRD